MCETFDFINLGISLIQNSEMRECKKSERLKRHEFRKEEKKLTTYIH